MADQITLPNLTPREAVTDAFQRCVLGMDSNNRALFESACLTDDRISVVAGPIVLEGWSTVSAYFQKVFDLTTLHSTSNVRVNVEDDADTASLTAHAIAYHLRPQEAFTKESMSYTAGCLYEIDLVKTADDGLWKIKTWKIKVLWTTGDRAVVHPEA